MEYGPDFDGVNVECTWEGPRGIWWCFMYLDGIPYLACEEDA